MARIKKLFASATNTCVPLVATPVGALKRALDAGPFKKPAVPDPAKVDTLRVATFTKRIILLAWSAIYNAAPSKAAATGVLNAATAPAPLAGPATPVPASVVTLRL
jgi:hypothetical protein